jgi:hypothetical protein
MYLIIVQCAGIIGGIVFLIVYFGYRPYQRHRASIKQSQPPEELAKIMDGLPEGWQLASYDWTSNGWTAELVFGKRRFHLLADYGYPGPIHLEEIGEQDKPILSSPYDHIWASGGPDLIRQQLIEGPLQRKDLPRRVIDTWRND